MKKKFPPRQVDLKPGFWDKQYNKDTWYFMAKEANFVTVKYYDGIGAKLGGAYTSG